MESDTSSSLPQAQAQGQGQGAVVSNLKDMFNKKINDHRESESSSGRPNPKFREVSGRAAAPGSAPGPAPGPAPTPAPGPVRGEKGTKISKDNSSSDDVKGSSTDLPIVLITNDDGIDAPGLRALVSALVEGGRCDVHVCAPDSDKSGTAQSITVRENLVAEAADIAGARAYRVHGTPADCVSLTLSGAFSWPRPTLVISGINKGSNCGYHVLYSGTVAGAREALVCKIPSIAVSLNWVRGETTVSDFKVAADVVLPLIYSALRDIKQGVFPKGCFLNVDIPSPPSQHKGFKVTRQGTSIMGSTWKNVSAQKRMNMAKEAGLGAQLAQLGLAASAAGAKRQTSSSRSTPVEIESTGAGEAPNGRGADTQRLVFRLELTQMEYGDPGDDYDFGALENGFVAVTPLSLLTSVPTNVEQSVTSWVSSAVDLSVPSAL